MGTEIANEAISGPLGRIRKAFAKAMEDTSAPGTAGQREEGTFESEHLSLGVKHVENALMIYAVPFQKQILKLVMDNFPAKEAQYEQEVRRQEADDNLLDATSEWPVEKIKKLTNNLKDLVL
jgi:hypothetical protein